MRTFRRRLTGYAGGFVGILAVVFGVLHLVGPLLQGKLSENWDQLVYVIVSGVVLTLLARWTLLTSRK